MSKVQFQHWNSFFKSACQLSNHEKGLQFELLTLNVLKTYPQYALQLENIWLLRNGVPPDLKKKLNLPNSDEGIDIIAQTYSGEYWAIQCKFKASHQPPSMRELSTFNNLAHTHCKNISMAILFHTGERGVKKKHLMGEKYAELGLEFWLSLSPYQWKAISNASQSKKTRPEVRNPREHQKNAIKQAQKHFVSNGNSRGRLIMPCGTGKSLSAFWIANSLKAKSVIIAVPSLNLIKQSLEDWTTEFVAINESPRPEWQVVCSDDSTSKLRDEFVSDVYSLGIHTTTKVDEITSFLKKKTKGRKIIFVTYQSSDRLAKASKKAKFTFDLAILDEAHKTVGVKSKSFSTLLTDKNISIRTRIFMTATERVLKSTNDDVLSMDDESVYGKRFYQLTFKDAIHTSPQIISDYKILTIAVTDKQIQELVKKNKFLTDRKNKIEEQDAQSLAAAIALRQATNKYGIKHAISFHRSIKAAENFTKLNERLNSSKVDSIYLSSYHISGQQSAGQRSQLLEDFKNDQIALMTNARCLTEGVDVPMIDCVLFADPKQSIVDIVQAAGRALRVYPGKKYGYIMMPLIVPDNMEFEAFTETTPFKQVAKIVTALSTQDERIVEEFKLINQQKSISGRRIEFTGSIPVGFKLDISTFAKGIDVAYWKRVGRANWRSFEEARQFVRDLNFKGQSNWQVFRVSTQMPYDIPTNPNLVYQKKGWISWGDWFGTESIANSKRDFLTFEEAKNISQNLKLKNQVEWFDKYKSGEITKRIPYSPNRFYKEKGWISWGDWLGTNTVYKKTFLSYDEAKKIVHKLNLNSQNEWYSFVKNNLKPHNIPYTPSTSYKNKGWISWADWLNTDNIAPQDIKFLPFREARERVHKMNIKNAKSWFAFCASGNKPKNIPSNPNLEYKNNGWISYGDWLGTKRTSNWRREFLEFNEAKKIVHSLKLKNKKEWDEFCKSGNKPEDIPQKPSRTYRDKGWKGLGDWLGTNTIVSHKISFRPFIDARKFAQSLNLTTTSDWFNYFKSANRPSDIPFNPRLSYKNKGWKGWQDFLGNK